MGRRLNPLSVCAGVVLITLSVSSGVSLSAKKDPNSLQSQIENAVNDKVFVTKVILGSSIQWSCTSDPKIFGSRAVDTEIYSSGEIRYYGRFSSRACPGTLIGYVPLSQITHTLPIGSRVRVTKVELKGDRVELWLTGPGDAYAKLKLMVGKENVVPTNFDGIMKWVISVLSDERVERIHTLEERATHLGIKLSHAESRFKEPSATAQSRLESAEEARQALKELQENRLEFERLTGKSTAEQVAEYAHKITDFDKAIDNLRGKVKEEQVNGIRQVLKSELDEQNRLMLEAGHKQPKTLSELEQRMASLKRCEEILVHRQILQEQLKALNEPISPSEARDPQREQQEIDSLRKALDEARPGLELLQLNNDFREMEKIRKQLLDEYTRFPSDSSRQRLLAHLQRMLENRRSAQKLGYEQAAAQAAKISRDIEIILRQR